LVKFERSLPNQSGIGWSGTEAGGTLAETGFPDSILRYDSTPLNFMTHYGIIDLAAFQDTFL